MSEDIKPDVIKKTQDTLGKFVKKPPLTEKLLRKPPFRFLHDIITAINKDTKMFDGIFTDFELKSENIKEKDDKIKFLFKLINTMKLMVNTDFAVRPSKIVAGHEPTKTNELLQALGKALQKNLTAKVVLEQIKTENLDLTKDIKFIPKKDANEIISRRRTVRDITPLKKASNEKLIKKLDSKKNSVSSRDKLKKQKNDISKLEKVRSDKLLHSQNSNTLLNSSEPEINLVSTEDLKAEVNIETTVANSEQETDNDNKENEEEKIYIQGNMTNRSNVPEVEDVDIPEKSGNEMFKESPTNLENASNEPILLESSSLPTKEVDKVNQKIFETDMKFDKSRQPSARPRTSLRPPSARPTSARPAAPRVRDRNDIILPAEKVVPLRKVNVIVEHFDKNMKDDDNENLVVVESTSNIPEITIPLKTAGIQEQPQGHLVAQILETQKELLEEIPKIPMTIEWDEDNQRNRETKKRYIENMRLKIQTITRAALPLGQIINFLQEDYDNITRELQIWRNENKKLNEDIAQQKILADRSLEPLRKQYTEVDEEIEKQKERNNILKSEIYRNQQRIDQLLTTII